MIHTSTLLGSLDRSLADDDVVVNKAMLQSGCDIGDAGCSHFRSFEIFNITITKQYRLVASTEDKKGTYTKLNESEAPTVQLENHECLVGFYNVDLPKKAKNGTFYIDLPKTLFKKADLQKISKQVKLKTLLLSK